MIKKLSSLLFTLLAFAAYGQFEYLPLSSDYSLLYQQDLYNKDVDMHTAIRPLRQTDVKKYMDVDSTLQSLQYSGKFFGTLVGKGLFSHHLIQVRTKDFDLSIDPILDFRVGKESGSTTDMKYINKRGVYIQGRIGSQVTFMTGFYEAQAQFPDYVSTFVRASSVVPGQGYARTFNTTAFDFSNAFGAVSYTPSKFFNFSVGQGKVFFGEGHRSTILSDGAFNYPYAKIETTVWKIKYVNVWSQMRDIRKDVEINNNQYRKKYTSTHYLSYNVNSRLNLSLFESVTYGTDTMNRGIEASFFNPIILYRPIEFGNGSDYANVLLGFAASYKLTDGLMAYGQFTLDELSFGELFAGEGSWRNKYSVQLGMKYANAFKVKNLWLRGELNITRPYTYQHSAVLSNYAHYGQPIAHTWGANFMEGIFQAHYQYRRIIANLQVTVGKKGVDGNDSINYGGDVYKPYLSRVSDNGNEIGQGIGVNLSYVEARLAYLVNPSYNMRIEGGVVLRKATSDVSAFAYEKTPYIYVGLRTALFNDYYDF